MELQEQYLLVEDLLEFMQDMEEVLEEALMEKIMMRKLIQIAKADSQN